MKLAILSDFDGTITTVDTAVFILERYAVGDWMEPDRQYNMGKITINQCITAQLEMIGIGQERIVKELDEVICPRSNFGTLVSMCRSNGHRLEITSAGLDFYIRHFLRRHGWDGLEVIAPRCVETPSGLKFEFPAQVHEDAVNFKEDRVRWYQKQGYTVAYVGDGTSDYPAAKQADHAFSIRGRTLSKLLSSSGREFTEIEDFAEMISYLDGI